MSRRPSLPGRSPLGSRNTSLPRRASDARIRWTSCSGFRLVAGRRDLGRGRSRSVPDRSRRREARAARQTRAPTRRPGRCGRARRCGSRGRSSRSAARVAAWERPAPPAFRANCSFSSCSSCSSSEPLLFREFPSLLVFGVDRGLGLELSDVVVVVDAAERERERPSARAATRMSTSPGASARVTVRDWTERSSGRVNNWPAASTSTSCRIVSPWSLVLVRVLEADHVHVVAGKDEARNARLLGHVDGQGPHPLGDVRNQPGGVPFGPSFFSTSTSSSSMRRPDPALLHVLERRERVGRNGRLDHPDHLDHVRLEQFLFLEVAGGDQNLLRVFIRLALAGESICWLSFMAPSPITTATASVISDLLFIAASHFPPDLARLNLVRTDQVKNPATAK